MRSILAATLIVLAPAARAANTGPDTLAAKIDARVRVGWKEAKATPAPACDDATFARRVHLDIVGRIPTVAEVRGFLADPAADKRAKLVRKLLASAAHARHWATVWRREWIPQADQPQSRLADEIDGWLAGQLRDNVGYDRIARELLQARTATPDPVATPTTFLTASEYKPENLAANTTRAFLGVNLDCAQCHDHPFARWTRDQFWETAAFFARPTSDSPPKLEIRVADTKRVVGPRLLEGDAKWPDRLGADTGRRVLAAWVTAKDNPFFAKNAVNRVWANLFGTGLVEPLDDLTGANPPSHPELLDDLAAAFADSGFDLKFLVAAVVSSKTYQLASAADGVSADPRLFARFPVRGLTGEQLYDSLRVAAGLPAERSDADPVNALKEHRQFAERFRVERTGTAQRSILQSLALMNGPLTVALTDPAATPTLRAVADAPFLDTRGKLDALFLAAVGRKPTAAEATPLGKYVAAGGPDRDEKKALADVFWSLLNGSEFGTNH